MSLFTVTIEFADCTKAVEQIESDDHLGALVSVLGSAESLRDCDKSDLKEMCDEYLKVTHVADMRGVWMWHHCHFDRRSLKDIYGGSIVQTDTAGPMGKKES